MDFDRLDDIARSILAKQRGARDMVGVLSTGERVYVALAANDIKLAPGYTIAQAINRLDIGEVMELAARWKYN